MTEQQLQTIKDTGFCHETLKWERVDEGEVEYVGGEKVNKTVKRLVAKCAECNTIYKKLREDSEEPTEPTVIDLDAI